MEKKPKVSIIIPVYNGANYMKEAINSALAQTYKNIEIIVVNDGSDDNGKTRKIAQSYGDKIKYFEKENGGVSTALNLAIENMSGEYFSWLSHDDRYYKDKIETQIDFLKEYDENTVVYSDYDLMNEYSEVFAQAIKNHKELLEKPEYALLRGAINGITLLIPKKAFDDCGNFRLDLRCVQDYELWLRIMKKYKFVHQDRIVATTRLHEKQVGNTSPKMLEEGNPFWIDMIESFSDKTKIRLNGSIYDYYKEMANFLKTTPYDKAEEYCEKKYKNIEKSVKTDGILVSVIIPFYNGNTADEVIRAIKSVQKQTYKNIEILLINDGSKDNVLKITEYIDKSKDIKLINIPKNAGVANARNKGIEEASGDYISFLDADDEFTNEKIDTQLKQMILHNTNVSHTSYYREGFNEKVVMHSGIQNGIVIPELIRSCQIATPTVMIKKKYLNDNKYRFNKELVYGEDTCFWMTILKKTPLLGIDLPLSIVHANSTSAAYSTDKQLIGIKTILKFVLSDDHLNIYDEDIASLCNYYRYLVNTKISEKENKKIQNEEKNDKSPNYMDYYQQKYYELLDSNSWKLTAPLRFMKSAIRALIKKGPVYCIKRAVKKFSREKK